MRIIRKGATSQSLYVEILDSTSTTGARKTGLAYNTASLVGSYVRNGAARAAITLVTQTAAGAWSSGGFVEVDATNMPGVYRVDVPDAAFATGVESVVVTLKGATGMVQVSEEVQLTAVDLQDAVRAALTALPNAAAEAAGGLYTRGSGAGQINQNASGQVDTRTVAMATDVITAAAIQADAIGAAEIANGAIDAATFAAGAIDATAIAADAIGASELAAGAASEIATAVAAAILATPAQLLVTDASGRVTVGSIAASAITATSIAADAITATKIADGAIDAATFAAGAIDAAAIATDAIGSAELAATAVAEIAAAILATPANLLATNASGQVVISGTATGAIAAASFAAGAIDNAAIATDAIGSAELAATAVTEIQTGLATSAALVSAQADLDDIQTRLPAALVGGRIDASVGAMASAVVTAASIAADAIGASELAADAASEIATAVRTELTTELGRIDVATSSRLASASLVADSGTAQAGAASTVTLRAGAVATDNFYAGQLILITGATGAGQARLIASYVGATKVATVQRAWATNPDNTSTYAVLALDFLGQADQVWDETRSGHTTSGSFGEGAASVQGNVTGSVGSIATGGIAAASFAAGAIDAAAIATDAIGSAELAASAVTEIQSGLATASALTTAQADLDDIQARLPAALVSGRIDASVGAIAAAAITATSIAADAITAAKVADGTIDAATFAAGAINAAAIATDAITAAKIAADAIGASELAADAVTEIQSGLATSAALASVAAFVDTEVASILAAVDTEVGAIKTVSDNLATAIELDGAVYRFTTNALEQAPTGGSAPTAAAIADAVWDETLSGHLGAGSTGEALNAAGAAGDPWVTALPGAYGAGSAGAIVGALDDGVAAIQADTDNIQTRLPAALVGGRMDSSVGAMAADVVTASAIAADAIGSSELAATAVTEIQSGLATSSALTTAQADLDDIQTRLPAALVSGRIDASVGAIAADAITAAATASDFGTEVGTAVWATTTRALTDKAGFSLSSAGVQAIWDALTSALTAVGSVGKLLVDNVNATVSSRASQTSVDTIDDFVDTEVAAIKAKTDLIPASPAAVGSAMTLAAGAVDAAAIATGAIDADALAADAANEIADALLDRTAGVETGRTPRQALRLMLAAMAGKLSGAATATVTIRDTNDTKNRVVASVDSDGNRTAVTLDSS